jgi:transposase InsO family protein
MPWNVKDLISRGLEFVSLASQSGVNRRELCRRFGISPRVGYKWLRRYATGGVMALQEQSRRPRRRPAQTAVELEARVVALRQEHPVWGARKLRRRLEDLGHGSMPATSTTTGILHRHGLIAASASIAAEPYQRFERAAPNELWQADFKGHFALRTGRCPPLCALDDNSRYNILLQACPHQQETLVQTHLQEAFRRQGLPNQLLWDNGSPWGCGGEAYTTLDVWPMRLGIRVCHGRPYHPQTQGKEERFHRALQAAVLARGGWNDCAQVQHGLDAWRPVYNTQRPHDALALATPVSRYRPSQRSYPEMLPPIEYAPGVAVRRVDQNGWLYFGGTPWKIGRTFVGLPVGIRPTARDGVLEAIFLTQVIEELNLHHSTQPTP